MVCQNNLSALQLTNLHVLGTDLSSGLSCITILRGLFEVQLLFKKNLDRDSLFLLKLKKKCIQYKPKIVNAPEGLNQVSFFA